MNELSFYKHFAHAKTFWIWVRIVGGGTPYNKTVEISREQALSLAEFGFKKASESDYPCINAYYDPGACEMFFGQVL